MKSNSKFLKYFIALLILSMPLFYAMYVYDALPETIPIHFNYEGKPDGFGSKDYIYLAPIILGAVGFFVFALIFNVQLIDSKRYQESNSIIFKKLAFMLVFFMSSLSFIIVYSSLHPGNFFIKYLYSLMGLLFAFMGYIMPSIKPNYFVGMRLPWTLENADNWTATHKMAGKWWMVGGVLQALIGFVFPAKFAFISFMVIMGLMVAIPAGFSYQFFIPLKSFPLTEFQ
jgi:uncharacterized membrane protein